MSSPPRKTSSTISRRKLLRGGAGIAIGLPLLDIMRDAERARAQSSGLRPPRRFMTFFTPHGTVMDNWRPLGSETSFTLPRILQPLEPYKKDIVVIAGLDNKTATGVPDDTHTRGTASLYTAVPLKIYNGKALGDGISVDQVVASGIGKETRWRSLELSVLTESVGNAVGHLSYSGPGAPLPPEGDPAKTFARVFSGPVGGASPAAPADMAAFNKLWGERRTVLDAIREEHEALAPKLSAADRLKIDQHFAAIRDVEKRLSTAGGGAASTAACQKPALTTLDPKQQTNMPAVFKLQLDILAMAFACDLVRVASLHIERARGQVVHSWLGSKEGHHSLSHRSDAERQELMSRIGTFYAQNVAAFLKTLASIPEGGGTLLSSLLFVWGSDNSDGARHSLTDMPFLLAGHAGGALRTGRFLSYRGEPHNNLLVSLLNLCGNPATTFGNPATCTGPLASLA